MKIEDLLTDQKYNKIVDYFSLNSIQSTKQVSLESIQNIVFIPGVDMNTLKDAKSVLSQALKSNSYKKQKNIDSGKDIIKDKINIPVERYEQFKIPLEFFLGDIPRAHKFLTYCKKRDVHFVHEINEFLLEKLNEIRGIGILTAKKIKERFLKNEQLWKNIEKRKNDRLIEHAFHNLENIQEFTEYCIEHNYKYISDLKKFPFETIKFETISYNLLSLIRDQAYCLMKINNLELPQLEVHPIYYNISFKNLIETVSQKRYHSVPEYLLVDDFIQNASTNQVEDIKPFLKYFKEHPVASYERKLATLNDRDLFCVIERVKKKTLEEIGISVGISRERIRQILSKVGKYIQKEIDLLLMILSDSDKKPFSSNEVRALNFSNDETRKIFDYYLYNFKSEDYISLEFTDKIIPKELLPKDFEVVFSEFVRNNVLDGTQFDELYILVEEKLKNWGIDFISVADFESYLINHRYSIYANTVRHHNYFTSYATQCIHVIEEHFEFDIKLDSKSDNKDLKKLREIMARDFPDVIIGKTNRSLSARLMDYMILSGRGRYCPVSKTKINKIVFNEIYEYIINSKEDTLSFNGIYEIFKESLQSESKIDNRYYLQGVLKYLYSDAFDMNRDSLTKIGSKRQSLDERVEMLLISYNGPMKFPEVKARIPGLTDTILHFIIERNKNVVFLGNSTLIHRESIKIDNQFEEECRKEIDKYCLEIGYISSELLYNNMITNHPDVLSNNHIDNSTTLYYIAQFMFAEEYNLSRSPHILVNDLIDKVSSYEIIKLYVMNHNRLNKDEIDFFANRFKWNSVTKYTLFNDIDIEFVRIGKDDYFLEDKIDFSESFINKFDESIDSLMQNYSFYPLVNLYDFSQFPKIEFAWNQFLVESLVRKISRKYSTILPKAKDRRYMRTLIVRTGEFSSFEKVVISLIKSQGKNKISEHELENLLNEEGIVMGQIPKELYVGEEINYNNDYFICK